MDNFRNAKVIQWRSWIFKLPVCLWCVCLNLFGWAAGWGLWWEGLHQSRKLCLHPTIFKASFSPSPCLLLGGSLLVYDRVMTIILQPIAFHIVMAIILQHIAFDKITGIILQRIASARWNWIFNKEEILLLISKGILVLK